MQLFNVNGDSAYALDVSVHYPMLQMIVFFDCIKLEDVANGTACPRSGHSQSHTFLVRVSTWKWAEAEATGTASAHPTLRRCCLTVTRSARLPQLRGVRRKCHALFWHVAEK